MHDASDSGACAALRADISDIPRAQLLSEIARWHPREDYLNDRAYRLLVGVRDEGVVPPIEPEREDNLAREQGLGRLPLPEAFARLAATKPALGEMERRARDGERPRISQLRQLSKETGLDPTSTLVGRSSESSRSICGIAPTGVSIPRHSSTGTRSSRLTDLACTPRAGKAKLGDCRIDRAAPALDAEHVAGGDAKRSRHGQQIVRRSGDILGTFLQMAPP